MKKSIVSLTGTAYTVGSLTLCFFVSALLLAVSGILGSVHGQWLRNTIDDDLNYPQDVYVADMDADYDLDVVATGYYADSVVWKHRLGPDTS